MFSRNVCCVKPKVTNQWANFYGDLSGRATNIKTVFESPVFTIENSETNEG